MSWKGRNVVAYILFIISGGWGNGERTDGTEFVLLQMVKREKKISLNRKCIHCTLI